MRWSTTRWVLQSGACVCYDDVRPGQMALQQVPGWLALMLC